MKKTIGLIILTALLAFSAFADVALPEKTNEKAIETNMVIEIDEDATEARLVISRELLNQLAQEDGIEAVGARTAPSGTQTLVSGLFLSLAVVFGGVWLARSQKTVTSSKIALSIAVFSLLGVSASIAIANIAPPRLTRINSRIFTKEMIKEHFAFGQVRIEVVEELTPDSIRLVVPREKSKK